MNIIKDGEFQGLTFIDCKPVGATGITARFGCDIHGFKKDNGISIEFFRKKEPLMTKLSEWYSGVMVIPFSVLEHVYFTAKKIREQSLQVNKNEGRKE